MKKLLLIFIAVITVYAVTKEELKIALGNSYQLKEFIINDSTYFVQIRRDGEGSKGWGLPLEWEQKPVQEIADSLIKWYNKVEDD